MFFEESFCFLGLLSVFSQSYKRFKNRIKKIFFNINQNQIILMAGGPQVREAKRQTIERLYELFGSHKQIICANFSNVGSNQIQQIRKTLRAYNSKLVIAKNTLIKKVIKMRTDGIDDEFKHLEQQFGGKVPELKCLNSILCSKIALIFSDASIYELKDKIESNKLPTEARVGALSPIDFTVPAGATGLDPSQISFFHALNISTKIVKGQIQITKDFKVTTAGQKVKASEAALLKKLNLKPFFYGMTFNTVYDNGSLLPKAVLDINPSSLAEKFANGVKNLAGLSLSCGYTIEATIPLIIGNSFKNIAALSLESGYKIKELDMLATEAPKPVEKKEEKKKEAPKPKEQPKQQQEEEGMGGLFD